MSERERFSSYYISRKGWVYPNAMSQDDRLAVVIDPESAEDVQRLLTGLAAQRMALGITVGFETLRAALREYASPTPPRPDEPLLTGAVVRDGYEQLWVRTSWATWRCLSDPDANPRFWSDFRGDVSVLSDGYSEGVR